MSRFSILIFTLCALSLASCGSDEGVAPGEGVALANCSPSPVEAGKEVVCKVSDFQGGCTTFLDSLPVLARFDENEKTLKFVVPVGISGKGEVSFQCGGEEKKVLHKDFEISGPRVATSGSSGTSGTGSGSGGSSGSGSGGVQSCQRSRECSPGQVCNTTTHRCEAPATTTIPVCQTDSDCGGGGKKCESNRCVTPPIVVGPVCGNGTVETGEQCDDRNTTAGDGCSATCQNETRPSCTPTSCGTNEHCNTTTGGCEILECWATNPCPRGRICNPQGRCENCTSNSQCSTGQECQSGVCGAPPQHECTTHSDCSGDREICINGRCEFCTANDQCPAGLICQNGGCHTPSQCQNNNNCSPGQACLNGNCGRCTDNRQCASGEECRSGMCENAQTIRPTFTVDGPQAASGSRPRNPGYSGTNGLVRIDWNFVGPVRNAYIYGPFNRRPGDTTCDYITAGGRYLAVASGGGEIDSLHPGTPDYRHYWAGSLCSENPSSPNYCHHLNGSSDEASWEDLRRGIFDPADIAENSFGGLLGEGLGGRTDVVRTYVPEQQALSCKITLIENGQLRTTQKTFYTKMHEESARYVLVFEPDTITRHGIIESNLSRQFPRAGLTVQNDKVITVTPLNSSPTEGSNITTPKVIVEFDYQSASEVIVSDDYDHPNNNTCIPTQPTTFPSGTYKGECALNSVSKLITIAVKGEGRSNIKIKQYRTILGYPTLLAFRPKEMQNNYPKTTCDANVRGQNNQTLSSPGCPGTVDFLWAVKRWFAVLDMEVSSLNATHSQEVPWVRSIQFRTVQTGDTSNGGWEPEKTVDDRGTGFESLRRDVTHTEWWMKVTDFDGWESAYVGPIPPIVYQDVNAFTPYFEMLSVDMERVSFGGVSVSGGGQCEARDNIRTSFRMRGSALKNFRFWCEGSQSIPDEVRRFPQIEMRSSGGNLVLNIDTNPASTANPYGVREGSVSVITRVNAPDWSWFFSYRCTFELTDFRNRTWTHVENLSWQCLGDPRDPIYRINFNRTEPTNSSSSGSNSQSQQQRRYGDGSSNERDEN